jgi:hypothetical protein
VRRWLITIATFLTAGAVVNVAVAFVICNSVSSTRGFKAYNVAAPHRGFSFSLQSSNAGTFTNPVAQTVALRVGWPTTSMRAESQQGIYKRLDSPFPFVIYTGASRNTLLLGLRPVWPAFLANALFYGFFIWILVRSAAALLRTARILTGRCPHCGYPMGESPVCTECGKPLPKRAPAV